MAVGEGEWRRDGHIPPGKRNWIVSADSTEISGPDGGAGKSECGEAGELGLWSAC